MYYLFLIIVCTFSSNAYTADKQLSLETVVATLKKPTKEYQEAYSLMQKCAEGTSSDARIKQLLSLTQEGKALKSFYNIDQLQAVVFKASESGNMALASALSIVINASLDRFQPEEPDVALGDFDRVSATTPPATEDSDTDFKIILRPHSPSHTNQ